MGPHNANRYPWVSMFRDGSGSMGVPNSGNHHRVGGGGVDAGEVVFWGEEAASRGSSSGGLRRRTDDEGADGGGENQGLRDGRTTGSEDSDHTVPAASVVVGLRRGQQKPRRSIVSDLLLVAKTANLGAPVLMTLLGVAMLVVSVLQH